VIVTAVVYTDIYEDFDDGNVTDTGGTTTSVNLVGGEAILVKNYTSNDYGIISYSSLTLVPEYIEISFLLQHHVNATTTFMIRKESGSGQGLRIYWTRGTGYITLDKINADGTATTLNSTTLIPEQGMVPVKLIYNNGSVEFWYNNTLLLTGTTSFTVSNFTYFEIRSAYYYTVTWDVKVDELRIYSGDSPPSSTTTETSETTTTTTTTSESTTDTTTSEETTTTTADEELGTFELSLTQKIVICAGVLFLILILVYTGGSKKRTK